MAKKKKKKEKQPKVIEQQYVKSLMNNDVLNYEVYKFSIIEWIVYILIAGAFGAAIALVFYMNLFMINGEPTQLTHISNTVIGLLGAAVAIKFFVPSRKKALKEKRQTVLKLQFRELLAALNASFSAGSNMQNAFEDAYKDVTSQFGEKSFISIELREIITGMHNNINIENLLFDFGRRSGVEEIRDFSSIFISCFRRGGDIKSVVANTYDLIGDKITINEEIKTKLTGNKMQQNVMSLTPILIMGFMRFSSSSFAESFASFTGVLSITVAIGIFIGAIKMANKITDIKT